MVVVVMPVPIMTRTAAPPLKAVMARVVRASGRFTGPARFGFGIKLTETWRGRQVQRHEIALLGQGCGFPGTVSPLAPGALDTTGRRSADSPDAVDDDIGRLGGQDRSDRVDPVNRLNMRARQVMDRDASLDGARLTPE